MSDHFDEVDQYLRENERRIIAELEQREWEADDTRILTPPCVFRCNPDESGGYEPDDPKHPTYHERAADLWDMREGK